MTRRRKCDTITPRLEYEAATGYVFLTDGTHRQIICRKVDKEVILHWKFDGTAVPVSVKEWLAVFTTT